MSSNPRRRIWVSFNPRRRVWMSCNPRWRVVVVVVTALTADFSIFVGYSRWTIIYNMYKICCSIPNQYPPDIYETAKIIMLTKECPCCCPKIKRKTVNVNGRDGSGRGRCGWDGGGPALAAPVFSEPVAVTSSEEISHTGARCGRGRGPTGRLGCGTGM